MTETTHPLRVAVIGAGGMGGYFGAVLAGGGMDVSLLARGERLRIIREHGLRVESARLGDVTVPVRATDDPGQIGPVDLVLVCVKAYDVESAARAIPALLHAATVIFPVQNGVEAAAQIESVVGPGAVLGGVSWVTAHWHVDHVQHIRGEQLLLGELAGGSSARVERLCAALVAAGVMAEVSTAIQVTLWEKLMGICVAGCLSGATRLPVGPIFASPELSELGRTMMDEVAAVGRAHGVPLPADSTERSLAQLHALAAAAPGAHPSLYVDLVNGRRLELDALPGVVVRLGARYGIPTPAVSHVQAILSPFRDGPPVAS